jgi:hypothetical protein
MISAVSGQARQVRYSSLATALFPIGQWHPGVDYDLAILIGSISGVYLYGRFRSDLAWVGMVLSLRQRLWIELKGI